MKKYMIPALCFILLCCLGSAFAETALQPEDLMLQADAAAEAADWETAIALLMQGIGMDNEAAYVK